MDEAIRRLLQLLPEPSLLLNSAGTILWGNAAAGDLAATRPADLVGQALPAFLIDAPDKVRRYLASCARSRQLVPGALTWRVAGRDPIEIRCDAAVLQPRAADADAVLFLRCRPRAEATDHFRLLNQKITELSREITERKKAEQHRDQLLVSERAARLDAERNVRIKDEFLTTLSHELRTPLNAIVGWIHMLRNDPDSVTPQAQRGLEVIERNARVQTRLVEELLEISHVITGKVRLDVQRVNLVEVVEAALEAIRPAADAKTIRLHTTIDPVAVAVKGDPVRLQQILWNLLSNAVKFTGRGGRVLVSLERVNSHLEITVNDTGRGIAPEFLPHVFDRFRQEDASITRKVGGLGLGLSIVKHLVELHGGSVRASSPGVDRGATFVVALPMLAVAGVDEDQAGVSVHPRAVFHAVHPRLEEGANLQGVRVLVVDDDAETGELVQRLLESRGAVVSAVTSAAEGRRALAAARPDVIVSDIGMPGEDGFEFIRGLRRLPGDQGGGIPAVALTAFARTEDKTRTLLAGFQLHLAKPVDPFELIAAIASVSGRIVT